MPGIEDLKTDAQIASILKKLKDADIPKSEPKNSEPVKPKLNTIKSLAVSADEVPVTTSSDTFTKLNNTDHSADIIIADTHLVNEFILPWFLVSDRDTKNLHYIKADSSGKLSYSVTKSINTNDLASLKMKPDFICDIDYFKSRHQVLLVKQLESNYSSTRVVSSENESNILVEDTQIISDDNIATEPVDNTPDFNKSTSDNLESLVANSYLYYHYVVYTDLGVIDFIAKSDDLTYPYNNIDLNKWLEEASNYTQLINPSFTPADDILNDSASSIREFKYDIITMHRPGVITLDSMDNSDSSYQLHIKLKDEYSFLPLSNILMCLKKYATSDSKSISDFKKFINQYFDLII